MLVVAWEGCAKALGWGSVPAGVGERQGEGSRQCKGRRGYMLGVVIVGEVMSFNHSATECPACPVKASTTSCPSIMFTNIMVVE